MKSTKETLPTLVKLNFHSMSLLSSCRELGFFDPPHQAHLNTTEGEAPLPQSFVHLRVIASGNGKSPDSPCIFMLTSLYDYARRAYPNFRLGVELVVFVHIIPTVNLPRQAGELSRSVADCCPRRRRCLRERTRGRLKGQIVSDRSPQ